MLRKIFALSIIVILVCSFLFSVSVSSVSADSGASQIYFGAFVGPSHKDSLVQLQSFEATVGKGVAIWNWFQYWNRPADSENDPNFNVTWMDECRVHGSIPMITWDPGDGGSSTEYPNLSNIINGDMDSYITTWAQDAKAWGHPFFIRLMHEFTGGWTPYYEGVNGNAQGQFVQAWQHIVNIFRNVGANNVSWVWEPANTRDSIVTLTKYYPGNSYVDWTATDYYSDGSSSFTQGLSGEYNAIESVAPNKPFMLTEFGCTGSNLANWFNGVFSQIPTNFPNLKGLIVWEDTTDSTSIGVETATGSLSAFKQGIASNLYTSNVYGSLDTSPIAALGGVQNILSTSPKTLTQPTGYPIVPPLTRASTKKLPTVSSSSALELSIGLASVLAVGIIVFLIFVSKKPRRIRHQPLKRVKPKIHYSFFVVFR